VSRKGTWRLGKRKKLEKETAGNETYAKLREISGGTRKPAVLTRGAGSWLSKNRIQKTRHKPSERWPVNAKHKRPRIPRKTIEKKGDSTAKVRKKRSPPVNTPKKLRKREKGGSGPPTRSDQRNGGLQSPKINLLRKKGGGLGVVCGCGVVGVTSSAELLHRLRDFFTFVGEERTEPKRRPN